MKKNRIEIYFVVIIFLTLLSIGGCCIQSHYQEKYNIKYEKYNITDSVKNNTIDSINAIYLEEINNYRNTIDSLNKIKSKIDTIYIRDNEELLIAKYKLERIRYYNEISAKGNNIKYLRGWINRVLNN